MQDKRRYDPVLLASLKMLRAASAVGFALCILVLLHGGSGLAKTDVALYLVWFGISMLSVHVMLKSDIWGAYALGIATVAITFYDLARGMTTIGGATLGILVFTIIVWYIRSSQTTPIHEDLPSST